MNKKYIFTFLILFFFNSCTIWDYELKKIEEKKEIEKISNSKIFEEIKRLKEEMAEIRRLKEKEVKLKEKEYNKKKIKLTWEELELKILEIENKNLEAQNKKLDIDTNKKESEIKLEKWEHCLLDTCLYKKNIEIKKLGKINKILELEKRFISFIWKEDCIKKEKNIINFTENIKCKIASEITKTKTFLKKVFIAWKNFEILYINNFWDFYIKNVFSKNNEKYSIIQKIFDKNWNKFELNNSNKVFTEKFNLLKEKIKIANIEYKMYSNLEKINFSIKEKNIIFFNDKNYIDSKIIELKLLDLALEEKNIYKNYIFSVDKKLWIYILYSSDLQQSERIINLWIDKKWLSENIDKNWDFLDKELSEKIIWYYLKNNKKILLNKVNKKVLWISGEDFPIFNVKKFDEKGNFLLFLNDWYSVKEN